MLKTVKCCRILGVIAVKLWCVFFFSVPEQMICKSKSRRDTSVKLLESVTGNRIPGLVFETARGLDFLWFSLGFYH